MNDSPTQTAPELTAQQREEKKDALHRYEDARREHLGAANSVTLGLSAASVGFCASLLTSKDLPVFTCPANYFFVSAVICFMIAVGSSMALLWTRLRDFRWTARKLRQELKNKNEILVDQIATEADYFGKLTWALYRVQLVSFAVGLLFLLATLGLLFHRRIFP